MQYSLDLAGLARVPGAKERRQWEGHVQQEAVWPSLVLGMQYSLVLAGLARVPGAKEQRQWAGRVQQEAV